MGAALFAAALFGKCSFTFGLAGAGLMFLAVTGNLLVDYVLAPKQGEERNKTERFLHLVQAVMAFGLTVLVIGLALCRHLGGLG
jgi:hypothetical protein